MADLARLYDFRGYLFDLDGVLWTGDVPVPGAVEVLDNLRGLGKKTMFVSNSSSRSRSSTLRAFKRMNMRVESDELFLASEETAKHLAILRAGARVFLIGSGRLADELRLWGLHPLSERDVEASERADFVVVGKDRYLTYHKLTYALRAIQQGGLLVAVNEDVTVPTSTGLEPGAGAIVSAICAMIGRGPDITIGKPSTFLLERALESSGLCPEECLMVGDTPETDILAGQRLGLATALVLSGNTASWDSREQNTVPPANGCVCRPPEIIRPDWVLPSVGKLLDVPPEPKKPHRSARK